MSELVRFTAHGHPELRARHGKTLEFTADTDVTGRATCVLGVAAELPSAAVAGPIRLTVAVTSGDRSESISLDAIGNSAWQPGGSAVVRRSPVRLRDTFATDATMAAADLPRSFAAALTDPSATVSVAVNRLASEPALIRFRLSPTGDSRLLAEAAAADTVLAEDAGARTALAGLGIAVSTVSSASWAGRVLSVSAGPAGPGPSGPSGPSASDGPFGANGPFGMDGQRRPGWADEVIGWPAELAVSAATPEDGPVLWAPAGSDLPRLAAAQPDAAVVFRVDVDRLARTLTAIGRPDADLVLVTVADPERPWRIDQSELVRPDRGEVICRIAGRPGSAPAAPVDPAAFVRGLLAEGASTRTVALALAGLPGWSRRVAYDFVLSLPGS